MTCNPRTAMHPPAVAAWHGARQRRRVGDVDLGYWRGGIPGRPPMLFLHGLGWDSSLWWPFVERYLDRFDVICPDTRGHGISGKPPGPYSIDLFATDILGLLDALGLPRLALGGLSQGGMA